MDEPDPTRQIMHVLLDFLAAVDVDDEHGIELPEDWARPMTDDLTKLGAIKHEINIKDSDITVTLDVTQLLGSAVALIHVLVRDIEDRAEKDRLVVINAIRERIDEVWTD